MEEAHELLAEIENSLLELEETPDDKELVGRVFRAMHTIKGSGAMFGFDDIAAFTRRGGERVRQGAGRQVISHDRTHKPYLAAKDRIRLMLDGPHIGEAPDGRTSEQIVAAFQGLASGTEVPDSTPLDRVGPAVSEGASPPPIQGHATTYRIRFVPSRNIFLSGTNPPPSSGRVASFRGVRGRGASRRHSPTSGHKP